MTLPTSNIDNLTAMKKYLNLLNLMMIPIVFGLTGCREKIRLVAGCYTETGDAGINVYDFKPVDGTLKLLSVANAGPNPSYLCFSGKRKLIYAINEVSKFNGTEGGGLTTLKYNRNFSKIQKVNEIPVPNGGPCYISITLDNQFLLIANYEGGSVTVVRLGRTGIPKKVTENIIYAGIGEKVSHAHMISPDPQGNRVYMTDLGLDRIMIYTLDKFTGKLIPFNKEGIPLPPGTGPRHFVFNTRGSEMFVIGELNSTVNVFQVDDKKGLIFSQSYSTLREGFKDPNNPADIHITKYGEYLYGSNRGENTIVTLSILKDGKLILAGHTDCGGDWPRNFVIDPSGKFMLVGNERSGNISIFKIDRGTGMPTQVTQKVTLTAPACLKFLE
jgi:6-phosphogluconolactonase